MSDPRVLVVDDNRDLADGIAMLLAEESFDVSVAYAAQSAIKELERTSFDLLLTDVRMPKMDGMELLQVVMERWPRTKVVVITAHGSIDAAVDAMKHGAADYITKPFDNHDLIESVARNIRAAQDSPRFDTSAIVSEVTTLVSPDDLLPSLRRALNALLTATGADDCELFLREPGGGDSLLAVWAGPDGEALTSRTRFEGALGYPGIVAATGETLVRHDVGSDDRYLRPSVQRTGISSYACAPLLAPAGPLGSIHLLSRDPDFPAEAAVELLQRAAAPIASAIRAGLASLREKVHDTGAPDEGVSPHLLRALLLAVTRFARSKHGTLALVETDTGVPAQVISTGPGGLLCAHAEAGAWQSCPSLLEGHAVAAGKGRRAWPVPCRRGLPKRVDSPCCLPISAHGRFHGLITLDLGSNLAEGETAPLVPLLAMAHQVALRIEAHHAGMKVDSITSASADSAPSARQIGLTLRCLGPFTVLQGGRAIAAEAFPRSKSLALLKLLALKAGTPQTRDYLIDQLWPDADAKSGANRLHGVVHALRSVIEPLRTEREWIYVKNRGELYYLDLDAPVDVDVVSFRALANKGLRAGADAEDEALESLEAAVDLYGGGLFEDDPYAEWCEEERRELSELHLRVLERLSQMHARRGAGEDAVTSLRRALRIAPYREDILTTLCDLLHALGRPREARELQVEYQRRVAQELS